MDEEESDYLRHAKWLEGLILKLVQAQYMADPTLNAVPLDKNAYLSVLLEIGREAQRHRGLEESRKLYAGEALLTKAMGLLRDIKHEVQETGRNTGMAQVSLVVSQNLVDRLSTVCEEFSAQ